ncbi:MAG: DciA family protein [Pseudomonadota bacterium]
MHISQITQNLKYKFIQKHKGDVIAFLDHNWKNIVKNPEYSYPSKINNKKLYVQCSNNAEQFILYNQKNIIINKINCLFPDIIITEIVFSH